MTNRPIHKLTGKPSLYQEDIDKWWLSQCLRTGMTFGQLRAIVDKYLNNYPEEWHKAMNMIVYQALLLGPCNSYFFTK